jgi:putative membrane protein
MTPTGPSPVTRRAVLTLALAALPAAYATRALAVDALPDARFVGYAQAHNDFEIASARLALAKSGNENVRGFANRMLVDSDLAAQNLAHSRSEAGVTYAPDPNEPTVAVLRRLSSLEGPQFDVAYANAQLAAMTNANAQYGAFSEAGQGGPLRRYAQEQYPKIREHLEYAKRLAGGM